MKCLVKICKHRTTSKSNKENGISFHSFPNDLEIRSKWIKELSLEDTNSNGQICSVHFDMDSFHSPGQLTEDAIPINDPFMEMPIPFVSGRGCNELIMKTEPSETTVKSESDETNKSESKTIPNPWNDTDQLWNRSGDSPAETPVKLEETCRTCIGNVKEDRIPIFYDLVDRNIELNLFELNITKNDGLPQQICRKCSDFLIELRRFHQQAKRSQDILEKHFKSARCTIPNVELSAIQGNEAMKRENETFNSFDATKHIEDYLLQTTDCLDHFSDIGSDEGSVKNDDNEFVKFNIRKMKKSRKRSIDKSKHCEICDKSFHSMNSKKNHMELHNNITYQCDMCGNTFRTKLYLKNHMKRHSTAEKICPHCSETFTNPFRFKYHVKSHNPNKPFKCQYCEKSFLQQHHLSNHENTHTGARPYLCNICGRDFIEKYYLKEHLRKHEEGPTVSGSKTDKEQKVIIKNHECDKCGKRFAKNYFLMVHTRMHTGERPFKCDVCGISFIQKHQLRSHHRRKHEPESQQIRPPTAKGVQSEYSCGLCNKVFRVPSSLTNHMNKHMEKRSHVCPTCGDGFKRTSHLRDHIRNVHLKQKPYECKVCGKSFAHKCSIDRHMTSHSTDTPFVCTYCPLKYRTKKSLSVHLRKHTGERPYRCELCAGTFAAHSELLAHNQRHEAGRI